MLLGIHHLILPMAREAAGEFAEAFLAAGFAPGDTGRHPGAGTANTSVLMRDGAFVEFAWQEEGDDEWYRGGPRIGCFGFCSDDFEADVAVWADEPEAWVHRFERRTESGAVQSSRAGGPLARHGLYLFVVDRARGKYHPHGSEAVLSGLSFEGADAGSWERRLARWLRLERLEQSFVHGDLELSFTCSDLPGIACSARFTVPAGEAVVLPLAGGRIELVPAER